MRGRNCCRCGVYTPLTVLDGAGHCPACTNAIKAERPPYSDYQLPAGFRHAGKPLSDVPVDYLRWLAGQRLLRFNVSFRIRRHLAQRTP